MEKKYTTKEAAEFLKEQGIVYSPGTMEVWRCHGTGPDYVKIRNKVYYPEKSLVAFAQGTPVRTSESGTGRAE